MDLKELKKQIIHLNSVSTDNIKDWYYVSSNQDVYELFYNVKKIKGEYVSGIDGKKMTAWKKASFICRLDVCKNHGKFRIVSTPKKPMLLKYKKELKLDF